VEPGCAIHGEGGGCTGIQSPQSPTPRKVAVVCARVHPGETPASFVALALMRALVSRDADAAALLKEATVIVVPMMNPDGCSTGNYRSDAGGCDLNRLWGCASVHLQPALYHVLELLELYGLCVRHHLSCTLYALDLLSLTHYALDRPTPL
jgi:predicted deacylase